MGRRSDGVVVATKSVQAAGAALVLVGLIGCGGGSTVSVNPPPPIDATEALRAPSVSNESASALGYRIDWQGVPFVSSGARVEHVLMGDDVVATLDSAGNLSLLEASTGKYRGNRPVGGTGTQYRGLFRRGQTIFAVTQSELFGVDVVSQDLTVRQKMAHVVSTGPLVYGDRLIFGTSTGEVRTHDLAAGVAGWSSAVRQPISSAAVRVGDAAAVVSDGGELLMMDPSTGVTLARAGLFSGPGESLVSGDGLLFVASRDQSLYCFAPGQRDPLWRVRTETPLTRAPSYNSGSLYCEFPGRGMVGMDAFTGRAAWTNAKVSGRVIGQRRGDLVVWGKGRAWVLDAQTGDTVAEVELAGVDRLVADQFVDGSLLAIGKDGVLTRLVPTF